MKDETLKCAEVFITSKSDKYVITTLCSLCKRKFTSFDEFVSHIKLHILHTIKTPSQFAFTSNCAIDKKRVESIQKDEPIYSKIWSDAEDCDSIEEMEYEEELNDDEESELTDSEEPKNKTSKYDTGESRVVNEEHLEETNPLHADSDDDEIVSTEENVGINSQNNKIPLETSKKQIDSISEREFFDALIIEYEKEPVLWDPEKRSGSKSRKDACWRLTDKMNNKFNLSLDCDHVWGTINTIRHKYRIALYRETIGHPHVDVWILKKLEFLKECINSPLENRRKIAAVIPETNYTTNLSDSQRLELAKIYKNFPILWDHDNIRNRFVKYKQDAFNEMFKFIKENSNLDLTEGSLQNELNYIHQICSKEKKQKLELQGTNKKYKPESSYSYLEPNVAPFPCSKCGEKFILHDRLKYHYAKHDKSKPFMCPVCNIGVKTATNYDTHLRRHLRHFTNECEICGIGFVTPTEYLAHFRIHTGEKPFCCEICGISYPKLSRLNAHREHHQGIKKFKCPICSRAFSTGATMRDHMAIHGGVRDKECDICGKAFKTKKNLRQHKYIHAEKKKHQCHVCDKSFAQRCSLNNHLKTHSPHDIDDAELKSNHSSDTLFNLNIITN